MNSFVLVMIGGAFGFIPLLLAVLSGLKVIKIPYKAHKALGIGAFLIAAIHALVAALAYFGVLAF